MDPRPSVIALAEPPCLPLGISPYLPGVYNICRAFAENQVCVKKKESSLV